MLSFDPANNAERENYNLLIGSIGLLSLAEKIDPDAYSKCKRKCLGERHAANKHIS